MMITTEGIIIENLNRLAEVITTNTSKVQYSKLLINIIDVWQEVIQTVN